MAIDFCIDCNGEFENPSYVGGCCPSCHDKRHPKETKSILLKADSLVNGARQEAYANPVTNFERIADIASAITGRVLSPIDCCNVMIAVKLAREIHKHTEDNLIDCVGYCEILNRLVEANKTIGCDNVE